MTEPDDECIASTETLIDDYDSPWKDAVEHYFLEFMSFYFPDAYSEINWSKEHVFLDQELRAVVQDAELGKRFVDKLVRVTLLNGDENWIYIHIEVQGTKQTEFAERMFVYNYPFMIVIADLLAAWLYWQMSMSDGNQLLIDLKYWGANIP